MFLEISNKRYAVARRVKQGDTVKFLSVAPAVEDIGGGIKLFRDDGFLISEDNADEYARAFMDGSMLVLTNQPDTPDGPSLEYRVSAIESAIAKGLSL